MTCRRLFVLQCDHTDLMDDSYVKRCQREVLGSEQEDGATVKKRATKIGWIVTYNYMGNERHLCPLHGDDANA